MIGKLAKPGKIEQRWSRIGDLKPSAGFDYRDNGYYVRPGLLAYNTLEEATESLASERTPAKPKRNTAIGKEQISVAKVG